MARTRIWVLNFDAEDEMANPGGSPSNAVRARFDSLVARLGPLLPQHDVLYREGVTTKAEAIECSPRAWCPTPRALRTWDRLGTKYEPPPGFETLCRANHRSFCAALGQTLPHARFVWSLDELQRVIAQHSPTGQWLLKRPFGYTGRGRKKVRAGTADPTTLAWINASFAGGDGLQIEPLVERTGDFGLHGFLARNGSLTIGEPTIQQMDEQGAWLSTTIATGEELKISERDVLVATMHEVSKALSGIGYFGPFGIDAFRWTDATGTSHFNRRCDINARYSMGWAIGMGARRPDLDD